MQNPRLVPTSSLARTKRPGEDHGSTQHWPSKAEVGEQGQGDTRPLPLKSLCLLFLQSPQGRHGAQELALALPRTQLQVSHCLLLPQFSHL